jgi:hypothetical protein
MAYGRRRSQRVATRTFSSPDPVDSGLGHAFDRLDDGVINDPD